MTSDNSDKLIFIKRSASRKSHEHHGSSSWKIAAADFFACLTCFFLVMWLVAASTEDERRIIASAITHYSIFEGETGHVYNNDGSLSPIDFGGSTTSIDVRDVETNHLMLGGGHGSEDGALFDGDAYEQSQLIQLGTQIEAMTEGLAINNNIDVSFTKHGLRVVLKDNQNRYMFARGKSKITPFFQDVLLNLSPLLAQIESPIVISGHTDSVPYISGFSMKSNWELSTERANVARRALMIGGVEDSRILQVNGFADHMPLNPDDGADAQNRRIELFLLTNEARDMYQSMFMGETQSMTEAALMEAEANQPITTLEATLDQ